MTDITAIAPLRLRKPRPSLPAAPGLGRTLMTMVERFAQAAELAYARPFQPPMDRPLPSCPDSEAGRDPNW
jgi:hypothetical protein